MASYHSFDYGADFYIKAPISFEMMRALAENPQAIAEGASGAPRVAIAVGGKTAIATENLDPTQVLRPDGNGGVAFGPDGAAAQMWDAGPALTQAIGNGAGVAGGMAVRASLDVPLRDPATGRLLSAIEASIPNVGNLDYNGAVSAMSLDLRTGAGVLVAAVAPLPAGLAQIVARSGNNVNANVGDFIAIDPISPTMTVGYNTGGYMGAYLVRLVGIRRVFATAPPGSYLIRANVLSSGSFHNRPPLTVKAFY